MDKGKSSLKLRTNSKERKTDKSKTVSIAGASYCNSPERRKDSENLYKAVLKDSASKHGNATRVLSPVARPRRASTGRKSGNEFEFHCSFDESDEENDPDLDLACTQPVKVDQILTGVVAYIEVRSNTENRFDGISKQMELLGATVVRKFIPEVTHVVFKDGKKATREKAIKKSIHLVTVLWVESCRETGKRVSEDLFPVIVPDEVHTPLMIGKLKRTKSMQPKSFEEDVRNSAEKEKKKKRAAARKTTPVSSPLAKILCEDTQAPYSPSAVAPSLSPGCIPATPLHRVLDSPLDESRDEETIADKKQATDPTIKRLKFDDSGSAASLVISVVAQNPKTKTKKRSSTKTPTQSPTGAGKTPVIQDTPADILITGSGPLKKRKRQPSMKDSDSSEPESKPKAAKKVKRAANDKRTNPEVTTSGHINKTDAEQAQGEDVDQGSRRRDHGSVTRAGLSADVLVGASSDQELKKKGSVKRTQYVKEVHPLENAIASDQYVVRATGRDTRRNTGRDMGRNTGRKTEPDEYNLDDTASDSGFSLSDNETRKNKKRTNQASKKKKFSKTAALVEQVSPSLANKDESKTTESDDEKLLKTKGSISKGKTKYGVGGKRRTAKAETEKPKPKAKRKKTKNICHSEDENDSAENDEIADECIEKSREAKECREAVRKSSKKGSSSSEMESTEDEGDKECVSDMKSKVLKTKDKRKTNKKTKGEPTVHKKKPRRSLVLTSMHFGEQDIAVSVVRKLGGFYIADKAGPNTTHVIAGSARRTLNVLLAIAQGCWLVSPEWVMKSLEAGYWVDEEPYELSDDFPSAQLSRLERVNSGPGYRQELFTDMGPFFVAEETSPPRDALFNLITLCGGQICTSVRNAGVCVGPVTRKTEAINVTEGWVIDSITEHTTLSFNAYALNSPAKSRKQGSPSY